jgi:sulfatase maturation enzyme AslB (radical SAM superfamily)
MVFSTWSLPKSYHEYNWGDKVSCQLIVNSVGETVKGGLESVEVKNLRVRSSCRGTAGEDTASWKSFSVCCGDMYVVEISGDAVIACISEIYSLIQIPSIVTHTSNSILVSILSYYTYIFSTKAVSVCSVGTVQRKGAALTGKNLKAWTGPKSIVSSNHES